MPPSLTPPDYAGGSLVNLMAELEHRLTGSSSSPRLRESERSSVPAAATYILMVMDGLGAHQLDHPAAGSLPEHLVATIDAPFPSTTTVSLATIASGQPPRAHGLIGHMMYMPQHGVFNALKWSGRDGRPIDHPTGGFLPTPNLWERLAAAGIEPITVQPGQFVNTPLSAALYRGCRFEPAWSYDEIVAAALDLAAVPGRLILVYLGDVDFAAHLFGQHSGPYADALGRVNSVWEAIALRLPPHAALIGTADHGHIDYTPDQKHPIASADLRGMHVYGDPRALMLRGDRAEETAAALPGAWVPLSRAREWWGPDQEHPEFGERAPTGLIMADPGVVLLPGHMDRRLIGYHGGLDPAELRIPVLVA